MLNEFERRCRGCNERRLCPRSGVPAQSGALSLLGIVGLVSTAI
jgi:hypothetical protein